MEDRPRTGRPCLGKTEPPRHRAGATMKVSRSNSRYGLGPFEAGARSTESYLRHRVCHSGDHRKPLNHLVDRVALVFHSAVLHNGLAISLANLAAQRSEIGSILFG